MILISLIWNKKQIKEMKQKRIQRMPPNTLQFENTQKIYHENLEKSEAINVEICNVSEAYGKLSEKLNKAAKEVLQGKANTLTPNRKRALDKLNKAKCECRKAKERCLDIDWYRREIDIKRQEYNLAIRNHNEKGMITFFNKLTDYEVGERIKRTHKYLREILRNNKSKNPIIPMKKWMEELEKQIGQPLIIPNDQEELTEGPTLLEIKEIIQKLANGKAAGKDGIRNEYLKYANTEAIEEFWKILSKVWLTNQFPDQWREGLQIPIPKKRGPKSTADYRRITLTNLGYKIYASWLVDRLKQYAGLPGYHQAAFVRDRSTDDQMFYTRRYLEEYWNKGDRVLVASLDLRKAFDTVNLESIEQILLNLNVPQHIINRVRQAISFEESSILWEGIETEKVLKGKGIKQGCPMAPYIFTLIVQEVLTKVKLQCWRTKIGNP